MKKLIYTISILFSFAIVNSFHGTETQTSLIGSWQLQNGAEEQVLIFQDGYFSHTTFNKANKKFIQTRGGTYKLQDATIQVIIEFDTENKERIGNAIAYDALIDNNSLTTNINTQKAKWTRLDNGKSALSGNWRITGRMNNGQVQEMQGGPRKTLKLLSASRFQWMAINAETKEFFGTGGGTYTFNNGKYTENIEFFSRDSSRVGASLTFDGNVENNVWTHKGLNSKGEPLHELWTRVK